MPPMSVVCGQSNLDAEVIDNILVSPVEPLMFLKRYLRLTHFDLFFVDAANRDSATLICVPAARLELATSTNGAESHDPVRDR